MGTPNHTSADPAENGLYANYALGLLLLAYILSFVDRQVLSLLVGPIRDEFGITDFQFSLLHGFAFAIFYTVMGLPIGRLVDRSNRRNIIAIGVSAWSAMTCLCGFAQNYLQLFLARIGVGIGEASLSPAAYSILSDYFSADKLPRAIAIFTMGVTLGGGLAYMIGGAAYEFFAANPEIGFPLIGVLKPWQSTFVTVGLPGFIVAALLLTIREPARKGTIATADGNRSIPIRDVVAYASKRRRAYTCLIMATSMMAVIGYGTMAWYPEFLLRTYDMQKAAGGAQFGLIFVIAGTLGTFSGAWFAEHLRKRGYVDANMRLIMLLAMAATLPAVIGPLMPTSTLALVLVTPALFFHYAHFGVAVAALQLITPNQMRGQLSAVMLFMTNILGLAFGGSIIAFFTDFIFADDLRLNYSISVVGLIFYPLAALFVFKGLAAYRQALKEQ